MSSKNFIYERVRILLNRDVLFRILVVNVVHFSWFVWLLNVLVLSMICSMILEFVVHYIRLADLELYSNMKIMLLILCYSYFSISCFFFTIFISFMLDFGYAVKKKLFI